MQLFDVTICENYSPIEGVYSFEYQVTFLLRKLPEHSEVFAGEILYQRHFLSGVFLLYQSQSSPVTSLRRGPSDRRYPEESGSMEYRSLHTLLHLRIRVSLNECYVPSFFSHGHF